MKSKMPGAPPLASLCLAVAGAAASVAAGAGQPAEITIPGERVFPESLTSTRDGTVIFGSLGARTIFRSKPNSANAEAWIPAGTVPGLNSIFGVFADDRSNTLWACSGTMGRPQPGSTPAPSTLFALDLKTGAVKGSYPLPSPGATCNDIAVGADGAAYATDTANMLLLRLPKGGNALEIWAGSDGAFGPKGGVLDGVAVLGNRVLVNTLATSKFFAVPIGKDGKAGPVSELRFSRTIERPDGMRSYENDSLLIAETGSGGKLALVKIDGDSGVVTTLKEGFPGGPVSVTAVGDTAYVLEGQLGLLFRPNADAKAQPFRATAVTIKP